MKVAAIILFVLQGLYIFGSISNGSFFDMIAGPILYGVPGFSRMIGFFLPTIIGIFLLIAHGKRQAAKNTVSSEELAKNPDIKVWICSGCSTANREGVRTCQKCGVSREWSDVRANVKNDAKAPAVDPEATIPSRTIQEQPKEASVLLMMLSGPMAGTKFRCREGRPVFIGRDPSRCNLTLNGYTAVSGLHCRIDVSRQGLTVTDLNSSNGTFVGGVRLTPNQPASAANGAEIRLSNTDCIFRVRFE